LTVDYDHRDIKVKPDNYGIIFNAQGKLANVSREAKYYSPFNYTDQRMDKLTVTHDWRINDDLSMRSALIYDTRDLSFLRNGGGNAGNVAGAMTGREARQQYDDDQFITVQNELIYKLEHGGIKHTILGGLEYSEASLNTRRTSYALAPIVDINNPVVPERSLSDALSSTLAYDRKLRSDTVSVYVQDQVALSEQFKVRAGFRDDRINFSDKGEQAGVYRVIESSKSLQSGSLGAVYQPTRDWSIYTGVATGKFINIATEAGAVSLEPEKSYQTELGTKATLLDGRLGLNMAFFQAKRENYYVQLTPGVSTPDGQDESKGFDFDITSEPIKGLNLLANLIVQDVKVTSAAVSTNNSMGVVTPTSIEGNRPAGVAEMSGRVWASYTLQSGDLRGLGFGLGATYKGSSYADSLNLYEVPSYTVWDAAIFYKQPKWEIALNLRNLGDKTYYTNPTFVGALPGAERNALLSFRVKMD
jgi:iron complex outermembrane recepter protein